MRACMLVAIAFALVTTGLPAAQDATPAATSASIQPAYAGLKFDQGIVPAAYPETSEPLPPPAGANIPPTSAPTGAAPTSLVAPPPIERASPWYPAPDSGYVCPTHSVYRTSAWQLGTEWIVTSSHLTRGTFGPWPDDSSLAFRLNLGYEDEMGIGIRGRWWLFGQDVPRADLDLGASTLNIEFTKRLFIEDTELTLGAGPAAGSVLFELDTADETQYSGGGIGVVAELWHPTWRFQRTDLGMIFRGRYSLLVGEWEDDTGFVIPETDHDNMSIAELAWGCDLRRRFGRHQDKYWYAALIIEHQQWDSAMMTEFLSSSLGFTGINLTLGLAY